MLIDDRARGGGACGGAGESKAIRSPGYERAGGVRAEAAAILGRVQRVLLTLVLVLLLIVMFMLTLVLMLLDAARC